MKQPVYIGTKVSQEIVASIFRQVQDYKASPKEGRKGGKNRGPID
jgi:hypothetical protein